MSRDRPDVVGTGPFRRRPSTKPTSLRLHLPGEWEPQGAIKYCGPDLQNGNLAVAKVFPLGTERARLRFHAEFFNLFSHTQCATPVSNQSSGNFGKITATVGSAVGATAGVLGGGPRVIQGQPRCARATYRPDLSVSANILRCSRKIRVFAGKESQVVCPDIKIATRRPLWVRSRNLGVLPSRVPRL